MLKNIRIENYKSFKDQEITLKNLNVLIGQNGSGKSNFISLFKFFERLVDRQLRDYIYKAGGINNFLFNGFENSEYLKVFFELGDSDFFSNAYEFVIESDGNDFWFSNETIGYWAKRKYPQPYMHTFSNGMKESNLKEESKKGVNKRIAEYVYHYLKDLRVFHFHDTSDNAQLKLPQPIEDVYFLKNEAENIAPFLFYLKKEHINIYDRIVEAVQLVYPSFIDFELEESPTAKGKIVLRWKEKGSDNIFDIRQISDGTLRFICLATLLLQPRKSTEVPQTIVLDEPELGLHPFAIHVLSDLLKKASNDKQIIIATQSVTLVNHFDPEDLLIAERLNDGATKFERKFSDNLKEWLEDYTLGELWENNFLGGRP